METVGAATWVSSVKSLRPGGTTVISGATSGALPPAELTRIFFLQPSVLGSTMGTRVELERPGRFLIATGVRPHIDSVLPLRDADRGFAKLDGGHVFERSSSWPDGW